MPLTVWLVAAGHQIRQARVCLADFLLTLLSRCAQTPGLPVVFTLYFNNDDSGTNAGPGSSRITTVGAGGTPEGTTSRRKLLQRSRFTANLIFNHGELAESWARGSSAWLCLQAAFVWLEGNLS